MKSFFIVIEAEMQGNICYNSAGRMNINGKITG